MRIPAVSKRSLTASVLPEAARAGVSGLDPRDERVPLVVHVAQPRRDKLHMERKRVASADSRQVTSCYKVVPHERDALDLDLRALDREARHLDERRGRPRRAEDLLAHRVDERPVVDVGEEDRHLHDVLEPAAGRGEHRAHVLEAPAASGATTSSPPTSRPSPSTATIPET